MVWFCGVSRNENFVSNSYVDHFRGQLCHIFYVEVWILGCGLTKWCISNAISLLASFSQNNKMLWLAFGCRFIYSILKRFPFDYKSPLRYLAAFILQSISIIDLYFFVSCCVSLGIGIYMLVMALVEDIKTTLSSINGNVKSERNELHVMLKIYDTLEFHSTAMRLGHLHLC